MEPKIWGKYFWTTIHLVALGYPDTPSHTDAENYKHFYMNFWKVLPCYSCSENYKKHLEELPIDQFLKDNTTLFKWTVELHNIVNKELGKRTVTLEEATERYRQVASGSNDGVFVSIDSNWDRIIRRGVNLVVLVLAGFGAYAVYKATMGKGKLGGKRT